MVRLFTTLVGAAAVLSHFVAAAPLPSQVQPEKAMESTPMMAEESSPPMMEESTPAMMEESSPPMMEESSPAMMEPEPTSAMEHESSMVEEPSSAMEHESTPAMMEPEPTSAMEHESTPAMMEPEPTSAMEHESSVVEEPSSAMEHESTPAMMEPEPTSAMEHESSVVEEPSSAMEHETATATEPPSTVAPTSPPAETTTYGSGYNSWGSEYQSCVQKCIAEYGTPPPTEYTPPPAEEAPVEGDGKVYTVLVAPKEGVLRFYPPIMNATVGSTIKYIWNGGATNHTVSRSSQLDICNRTADKFFTSGVQSGDFSFTTTVNDTEPVFFYCSVGRHCPSGMFGVINGGSSLGAASSVGVMMSTWTQAHPDLAAAWETVHNKTQGTPADTWGNSFDASTVPESSHKALAENIINYRMFLAENPGVQELDSGASLPAGVTQFKIPEDISTLLSNSAANPAGAVGAPAGDVTPGTPTGSVPSASGITEENNSAAGASNAASSLTSSTVMVAIVAIVATVFAL